MPKLIFLVIFGLFLMTVWGHLAAQSTTTPPIYAAACAYSSSPPAVVAGKFYLVQCNSTGQLITAPQ